jgi:hypothetical protein
LYVLRSARRRAGLTYDVASVDEVGSDVLLCMLELKVTGAVVLYSRLNCSSM